MFPNKSVMPAALTILVALSGQLSAQSTTGTILGYVHDPTGAVVAGAMVTAVNTLTGERHAVRTDTSGDYLFSGLPVGTYRIEAVLEGFKRFVRDGIILQLNRNARTDILLEVGTVNEVMQVTGDVPVVDTHEVQVGALVDSRRVQELPLSGRNVYDLVSILPGVAVVSTETIATRAGNAIRVNGSRSRHTTFMLDGGFNTTHWRTAGQAAPSPDAVQEFNVIGNNFNAEFGRSAGAVVNVVTKSGTNDLHGTLYEYLRNDQLNAKNYFQSTVSPLRQNQFGASAGGPIARNRTFFFTSYESLRIRSEDFVNSAFPATEAERNGDFSAAAARLRPIDPLNRQPFPGGLIPSSRFDPVAVNILKSAVPPPNTSDGRLEAVRPHSSDQMQWLAKLDHALTPAHKLFGTFFLLRNSEFKPFGGLIPDYAEHEARYRQYNVVVNEDWVPSPNLLNEARFTYTRNFFSDTALNQKSWQDYGSRMPLPASWEKPYPPYFNISGRWQMGNVNDLMGQSDETFAVNETVSWTRSGHSLKFGTWYAFDRYDSALAMYGSGQVTVSGSATNNALADFLLGRAAQIRQSNGALRHFRKWDWESFAQDDWKIHKRLTLNIGLRYELSPRFYSLADDLQTFVPGRQSTVIPGAPVGLQFVGDPGIPRSIARLDRNNWAPRFGIVLDPFGDGKTAIRAGYGVFYSTAYADAASFLQNQPFMTDLLTNGIESYVDPYSRVGGNPFPQKVDPNHPFFTFPAWASWIDDHLATPYVQHYSLTVQHQLNSGLSVQLAYVGDTSRKLLITRDANAPIFVPGQSTAGNLDARRPILPGILGQISKFETATNAHYDSLQVTVERRFARGFSILGNYTFGKAIDEVSDDNDKPPTMAVSYDRRYDRAASSIDLRHILNISYVWELPEFRNQGWLGKYALGGWQLSGMAHLQSGSPVNVTAGRDNNLDGVNTDRPDVLGDPRLDTGRSRNELVARYFNTAVWQMPLLGSPGTAGRNLFYGPGSFVWDFSLVKAFPIKERHNLQFRAELFNFPNFVNLQNPVSNFSSAGFGRILSAGSARVIQFAVRYRF